jgi:sensor histidine kinase YesM
LLHVSFRKEGQSILVVVEDDGIGLAKSQELKTFHQREHQSRGLTNTRERINLLNDIYHLHIGLEMQEITNDSVTGTKVMLRLPLMNKHDLNRKNNFSDR